MHRYRIRKIIVLEIAHNRVFGSAVMLPTLMFSVWLFLVRVITLL